MRIMMKTIATVALLAIGAGTASAQGMNCVGRADFDACVMAPVQRSMNQNAASQQQLMQSYVAQNTPRIQQDYAQYRNQGSPLSFEQFVYWRVMTRNGADPANLQRAQQDQFNGLQGANRTMQEGYAIQRQYMGDNSRRSTDAVENWTNGAIRGVAPYVGPNGGQVMLPYAQPANQPFSSGGQVYIRDPQGTFYMRQGSGWAPMAAGR
ncbi:MAG: hypothetical protein JWR10_1579 [Rubritepida sp.]|nr:hypothetical protein [Rubritepida sp.]